MPWFKVDDTFHSHPKVLAAGNAAVGLYVRCGSYCSQHLTEGFIPAVVAKGYGNRREITALVEAGLWIETDDGYQMPDFLEYNPSAEQVKASRAAAAERQRAARERAAAKRAADEQSRRDSQRDGPDSHGVSHGPVTVPPTRPDPTPLITSSSVSTGSAPNPVDNDEDDDPRIGQAARLTATNRTKAASPTNPARYQATVARNILVDHGDELRRLAATYPEAPASVLAACIDGDRHSLAHYRQEATP